MKSSPSNIIQETYVINNNLKRISTTRELLELSTISYQKTEVRERSSRDQHRRKIIANAIEDMGFFFQQYLLHTNNEKKHRLLRKRITGVLEFIEKDLHASKEILFDQLNSEEKKIITAAIYILSSVETDREVSSCLNKALAEFTECHAEQLPCYIEGLSYGKHPQISNSLYLIKALAAPEIKKACETILQNRTKALHPITDNR